MRTFKSLQSAAEVSLERLPAKTCFPSLNLKIEFHWVLSVAARPFQQREGGLKATTLRFAILRRSEQS